ncbi:Hypothetical predicted protein [Cloeon dipterum]|uniref:Cytochrome P450 n=1 Tax=Cloeon dipterum TaxID=197152 RepID=A0A8S1DVE2_9INSE|nr:Hypothetical predicted protein [Cloeon dipterum]
MALRSCRILVSAPQRRSSSALASVSAHNNDEQNVKPYSSIPQPTKLPIFGHTLLYSALGPYDISKYLDALKDMHQKLGPIFRQQLQGGAQGEVVHLSHPEDIKKVLAAGGMTPLVPPIQEGSRLYRLMKGYAVGLGNMNGKEWQVMRKASQQQLLKPGHVMRFLPSVEDATQSLIDEMRTRRDKEGVVENIYTLIARWYLEITGLIVCEKRLGALNGSVRDQEEAYECVRANIEIFKLNSKLKVASPLFRVFPISTWRQLVRFEDTLHDYIEKRLTDALRKMEELISAGGLEGKYEFLTTMLSRKEISRNDMFFFVHSMFSDGLATVPSTIQSCIYSLTKNPNVQEKLYREIQSHGLSITKELTPEVLDRLSYTKAVIKETFRMFTLGSEVSRVLPNRMILSGYEIPAGTVVDVNNSVLLRNEKFFPQPDKFIPERWMRGDDLASKNAFLLTPFGHGARMCVGRRFSQQALHAGLARLVQRFKFTEVESDADLEYGQVYQTLLFPNREIRVQIDYRPQN